MTFSVDKLSWLLIPFIAWCLLPALSFNSVARLFVVAFLSLLVLLLVYDFLFVKDNKNIPTYVLVSIFLILYMNLTTSLLSSEEFTLRHLHFSMFLVVVCILGLLTHSSKGGVNLVIHFILLCNIVTTVITLYGLFVDYNISRMLSKSNEVSVALSSKGYGGYGFIYANLVFFPIFALHTYHAFCNKKLFSSIAILNSLNLFLCVLLIFKSQYTIAVIGMLLVVFFILSKLIGIKFIFSIMLFFLILLIAFPFSLGGSDMLFEMLEGTRYQAKFIDVTDSLANEQILGGTVSSRSDAYIKSFIVFFENPIFGSMVFDNSIGRHSDILDKFAQWGMGIGFLVIYAVAGYIRFLKTQISRTYQPFLFSILFILFWISSLNTLTMESAVPLILLYCYFLREDLYEKNS